MRTRQLRALRGAAAAAIAVLLAAVSHTIGGGVAPSALILIGVAALAWPITTALVGRRLSPAGLAAAVVTAQAALHVVFAFTSSIGAAGASLAQAATSHQHGQLLLGGADSVAQVVLPNAPMLAAHAAAAVASFVLLFGGERMLRTVAAWTLRLLGRATPAAPAVFSVPRATFADALAPAVRLVRGVFHRRGPPVSWSDVSVA